MIIMVPIKRVPDYNARIRIKKDQTGVELQGVKMSMNPFDEIALEEAIRLKEKGQAQEVIVVSVGDPSCQETLRAGLALGADRAIHVQTSHALDSLGVAKTLKTLTDQLKPSLILMGKQATDDDAHQTGSMLAALLDWPQGTCISECLIDGNFVTLKREVDEGVESLRIALPALLTTDLRLNTPRFASLPNIMKAKQKPLEVVEGESFPHRLVIDLFQDPEPRKPGIKVDSLAQLMEHMVP